VKGSGEESRVRGSSALRDSYRWLRFSQFDLTLLDILLDGIKLLLGGDLHLWTSAVERRKQSGTSMQARVSERPLSYFLARHCNCIHCATDSLGISLM